MATWFCSKTRADCDKQVKTLQKEIADYKLWAGMLQADRDKAKTGLADANARIDDHYAYMADGLPTMAEMIADGRAQKFDVYEFQRQYTKQTGRVLSTSQPFSSDKTKTHWIDCGYNGRRLPRDIFKKIVAKSRVNRFKYDCVVGGNNRPFICNDFAYAFFGEMQSGPWWDIFIGCVFITNPGHRVNMVWFTGEAELMLFEPQTDFIFPINMEQREIKQVIT